MERIEYSIIVPKNNTLKYVFTNLHDMCYDMKKHIFFKTDQVLFRYVLFSKFQIQKIHALIPINILTRQEDLKRFSCSGSSFLISDKKRCEQEQPELELTVSVYNINLGYNAELLETCHVLKEYAQYVAQVRAFAKDMPFIKGVEEAVDYCIREGILAEFLSKNRAEAIAVSIYEYDEKRHMKTVRQEGKEEGRIEGEDKIVKLFQKLMVDKKEEDLNRALSDREYRQKLCREYGIE